MMDEEMPHVGGGGPVLFFLEAGGVLGAEPGGVEASGHAFEGGVGFVGLTGLVVAVDEVFVVVGVWGAELDKLFPDAGGVWPFFGELLLEGDFFPHGEVVGILFCGNGEGAIELFGLAGVDEADHQVAVVIGLIVGLEEVTPDASREIPLFDQLPGICGIDPDPFFIREALEGLGVKLEASPVGELGGSRVLMKEKGPRIQVGGMLVDPFLHRQSDELDLVGIFGECDGVGGIDRVAEIFGCLEGAGYEALGICFGLGLGLDGDEQIRPEAAICRILP